MADVTVGELNISEADIGALLLQYKLEQFYYNEAALLDERRYDEWLKLFTKDTHYFMPVRRTMNSNELDKEFTRQGQTAFFDDTYEEIARRVTKLATGNSWSENPPSRQRHLVTNVRVIADDGDELTVGTNFHLYRTRLNSEEDSWIGSRRDRLRREEGSFRIARRDIFLEQTVILSRNMSNFF